MLLKLHHFPPTTRWGLWRGQASALVSFIVGEEILLLLQQVFSNVNKRLTRISHLSAHFHLLAWPYGVVWKKSCSRWRLFSGFISCISVLAWIHLTDWFHCDNSTRIILNDGQQIWRVRTINWSKLHCFHINTVKKRKPSHEEIYF